jgi:hypothetical protein
MLQPVWCSAAKGQRSFDDVASRHNATRAYRDSGAHFTGLGPDFHQPIGEQPRAGHGSLAGRGLAPRDAQWPVLAGGRVDQRGLELQLESLSGRILVAEVAASLHEIPADFSAAAFLADRLDGQCQRDFIHTELHRVSLAVSLRLFELITQ